eukprot:TRINITY_DN9675_c0_g2_i4.p1 TRINITY_DN9675_c0_g2~~TRINITY_DN9675_c0_g2_i4.p1  ORF type:complete len:148 (+),score=5.26 TRINITY_DN9675_c0_g2_i4:124-567(+)
MLASIIRPSSRFICVRQFVQLSTPLYQGSGASATGEDIPELLTDADFKNAVLATKDDKLSVFQFTAVWCGPCQAIKPQILNYSMQYPDVKFYKIDVDNNKISNTVIENQISAVVSGNECWCWSFQQFSFACNFVHMPISERKSNLQF